MGVPRTTKDCNMGIAKEANMYLTFFWIIGCFGRNSNEAQEPLGDQPDLDKVIHNGMAVPKTTKN